MSPPPDGITIELSFILQQSIIYRSPLPPTILSKRPEATTRATLKTNEPPIICLSNKKLERLGDPLGEIVTVSVAQIQRHYATS